MNLEFKNYTTLSNEEHIKLLSIRNSEHVRNNMKTKDIINIQEHMGWITKLEQSTTNTYYAVLVDDIICGAVYITDIDLDTKQSSWGLFFEQPINPFISSFSAYLLIDRIFTTLGIAKLNLEVNKLNTNAYKFDLNFGFEVYDEYRDNSDEYYLMFMNQETWNQRKETGLLRTISQRLKKVNYTFT